MTESFEKRFIKRDKIGNTAFSVDTPKEYADTHPYSLFATDDIDCDVRYVFDYADKPRLRAGSLF